MYCTSCTLIDATQKSLVTITVPFAVVATELAFAVTGAQEKRTEAQLHLQEETLIGENIAT